LLPAFGDFSESAEVDFSVYPPLVQTCRCALDTLPTSHLFEIFPCIIVHAALGNALRKAGLTGIRLQDAHVESSDAFRSSRTGHPRFPLFKWCQIVGKAGLDDFGMDRVVRLIISKRARDMIETAPHEGIIFVPGSKAPDDLDIERILFRKV
jgi:hypothetical protein